MRKGKPKGGAQAVRIPLLLGHKRALIPWKTGGGENLGGWISGVLEPFYGEKLLAEAGRGLRQNLKNRIDRPVENGVYLLTQSLLGVQIHSCNGSIAQLGEHLPYKQGVTGSSPVVPTKFGPVVQLVRMLACHARGQGFEPPSGRQGSAGAEQMPR